MKKWSLRVYLVIVHLLLIGALWYIGWHRSTVANLPLRVEWHWGSKHKDHPFALPGIEQTDAAIAKVGDEWIAVFVFENGQLEDMSFGWPGKLNEHSVFAGGATISTDHEMLKGGEDEFSNKFFDLDGDGIFEIERQHEADEVALRRAEWKTVWREDRLPDGSSGPREYFDPAGRLVFRVTEILPPLPPNASPIQAAGLAFSQRPTYLVERFESGGVASSETLTEEEHNVRNLVEEAGHPPRREWPTQRTPSP